MSAFANQLSLLLRSDRKQVSYFFKNQKTAKLITVIISILGLALLSALIYFVSYRYFAAVQGYEPFGRLTARYLVHSGMIISGWLVLLSAIANSAGSLSKPTKEVLYILTQPINKYALGVWLLFRPLFGTGILLSVFWVPAIVSFSQVFGSLPNELVIVLALVITFSLATLLQLIAGLFSLVLAPLVQGKETFSITATIIIALTTTIGLIRIILPRSLAVLFRIDVDRFMDSFFQLPLNNDWLPTQQIVLFFETTNFSYLLPTLLLGVGLLLLCGVIYISRITSTLQTVLAKNIHQHFWQPSARLWYSSPVMIKELLGIWRVKSERNALLFFVGLFISFFFFLQRALVINPELTRQPTMLLQFSLGAALFINTAAFLRIAFPLLSREAESAWYMISEPTPVFHWQRSKTSIGFLLAVVMMLVSTVGWFSMNLPDATKYQLSILTGVGIISIAGIISFSGLLVSNWQQGQSPQEVSTSLTGMIALTISLVTISGLVVSFGLIDAQELLLAIPVSIYGIVFAPLFLMLKVFSTKVGKDYQFSGDRQ